MHHDVAEPGYPVPEDFSMSGSIFRRDALRGFPEDVQLADDGILAKLVPQERRSAYPLRIAFDPPTGVEHVEDPGVILPHTGVPRA